MLIMKVVDKIRKTMLMNKITEEDSGIMFALKILTRSFPKQARHKIKTREPLQSS